MSTNLETFTQGPINNTWTGILPDLTISDLRNRKLTLTSKTLLKLFRILLLNSQLSHGFLTIIKFYIKIMNNLQEDCGCLSSVVEKKSFNPCKRLTKGSSFKICTKTVMVITNTQHHLGEEVWKRTYIKLCRLLKGKLSLNPEGQTLLHTSTLFYTNNWVQLVSGKYLTVLITIQATQYIFLQIKLNLCFTLIWQ